MPPFDFIARPERPEASRHLVPPMPRYCLKLVGEQYYMIPMIYEFGFEQYCKAWTETATAEALRTFDMINTVPGLADVPRYAIPTDLSKLTFEKPIEKPD